MKQFAIVSLVGLCLVSSLAAASVITNVYVSHSNGQKAISWDWIEDSQTVRHFTETCLNEWGFAKDTSLVTIATNEGKTLDMEKTLKDAGVTPGSGLVIDGGIIRDKNLAKEDKPEEMNESGSPSIEVLSYGNPLSYDYDDFDLDDEDNKEQENVEPKHHHHHLFRGRIGNLFGLRKGN